MNEVTQILSELAHGNGHATGRLLPLVYDELRQLAAQKLAHEAPGQTLQPTALVHEAYLRLVGADEKAAWENRDHFFAAAAEAMRRILVENARRKQSLKRGGNRQRLALDDVQPAVIPLDDDILALDEALNKLAQKHAVKAELVKLRYFAGCTGDEAARLLGISTATAGRYWAFARAWLHREIVGDDDSEQ